MKYKNFLLSTGEMIEVPWYMKNEDGYLFNNNTKLIEGLPGDLVMITDKKYNNESGILEDYTNFQLVKFIGKPRIVVSADSVHSKLIFILSHNTKIVEEFSSKDEIYKEYGETWEKSRNGEKLIKDLLGNTVDLKMIMVAEDKSLDYYISRIRSESICGNNLEFYLNELIRVFKNINWWIIEFKNNYLNDVFDVIIGVDKVK